MASLRRLKKDIDTLFFELISDCLLFSSLREGDKGTEAQQLIEEAVALRNEFFDRANNPDGKDNPALVRAYYTTLRRDLRSTVNDFFRKLSELAKK